MKSPAFQFYPADYLSDMKLRMLSWASRGLYMDLLCYCWREGWIPSDSSAIAQLCNCHDLAIIEPCLSLFDSHPNDEKKLVHGRLNKERNKQIEHSNERSNSGKKGAESRWDKGKLANSSAIKQPMAKNSSSSSSSSSDNIPPNPQGGLFPDPEIRKASDENRIAVGKLLGRRESTAWSQVEIKMLKAITPIHPDDMALMRDFYGANIPKEDDFRRTTVERLLKHWNGELDKARAYKQSNR